MSGHKGSILARAASILAAVAVLGLSAGCATQTCKEGDRSRFRCDPTASSAESPAALHAQAG